MKSNRAGKLSGETIQNIYSEMTKLRSLIGMDMRRPVELHGVINNKADIKASADIEKDGCDRIIITDRAIDVYKSGLEGEWLFKWMLSAQLYRLKHKDVIYFGNRRTVEQGMFEMICSLRSEAEAMLLLKEIRNNDSYIESRIEKYVRLRSKNRGRVKSMVRRGELSWEMLESMLKQAASCSGGSLTGMASAAVKTGCGSIKYDMIELNRLMQQYGSA